MEQTKRDHKEGLGPLIALAPFLGATELSKLVRERLGVTVSVSTDAPKPPAPPAPAQGPDLNTIIGLAPHLDKETVGQLVRAALSQQKVSDPSLLVGLAPHMDKAEFSRLVREQMPGWFGAQPATPGAETSAAQEPGTEQWPMPPTMPTPPVRPEELR